MSQRQDPLDPRLPYTLRLVVDRIAFVIRPQGGSLGLHRAGAGPQAEWEAGAVAAGEWEVSHKGATAAQAVRLSHTSVWTRLRRDQRGVLSVHSVPVESEGAQV